MLSSSLQSLIGTIKRDYISFRMSSFSKINPTPLDVSIYSLTYSQLVLYSTVHKLLSTYLHTWRFNVTPHSLHKFFSGSQCLLITFSLSPVISSLVELNVPHVQWPDIHAAILYLVPSNKLKFQIPGLKRPTIQCAQDWGFPQNVRLLGLKPGVSDKSNVRSP